MAEILGGQTILARALPTGVDGTRLSQWRLREGITWAQYLARTSAALGAFNADMMQRWGWLLSLTEEDHFEYPNGGSITAAKLITDLDRVDPISESTIAHQLELLPYGDAIGGTYHWMRDARAAQIDAQITGIVNRLKQRFETQLLTRWFTYTETTIATSGYSVPFVRGTGGNVDFAPPAYGGETFTTAHNHYIGLDSGSKGYDEVMNEMAEHLQEHGHEAPYTALVSRANIASYYALPDFVQPLSNQVVLIDRGTTTADSGAAFYSRANREFGVIGGFESEYGYIEVRASARIPTGYAGLVKSYGQNNARNPLAVRVHPDEGFGAKIRAQVDLTDADPVKKIFVEMEHGVGVGPDRTNGVAAYLVSGGVWADPTIS